MDRHGWTGARLARELGTSQPWVSMVLHGRRDPGLRRSAELLARAGWELRVVPAAGEASVDRREFLAAAATVAFIPAPSASPYTDPPYLDRLTTRLASNEAQMGGAPLAREATRHMQRLSTTGGRGPAWNTAASALARRAALVLNDDRRLSAAEHAGRLALGYARRAGDTTAQARALDTLSLITAYAVDGRAAAYASRGLTLGGLDPGDQAVLAARLARAYALTPDHTRQARRTLDLALDQATGPVAAEVAGNAGIAYTDLRLPHPAATHLARAVDLTAGQPFVQSLYLARQAKTAVRARQPEQAAQLMGRLAGLVPLVDSPRLGWHVVHLLDATRPWAPLPAVAEARTILMEVADDRTQLRGPGQPRAQGREPARRWTW